MRRLTLALLGCIMALVSMPATAGLGNDLFFRAHGATSVVLRRICVPNHTTPQDIQAVDFDTTNLSISISAAGDSVDSVFTYTGGNIDDYDATPPAWGNPTANALELEARANGCVNLHIRDEVFAVAGATEWNILFRDAATNAIMDYGVQVLKIATGADVQQEAEDAIVAQGVATEANVDANETKLDSVLSDTGAILADTGAIGSPNDLGGGTATLAGNMADLYAQGDLVTGTFLNCEVNTANFAGDADEFACILTDLAGDPVTQASNDLEGLQIVVTSGDQIREARFINNSTWDAGNSELQLLLSRPLPAALADAVSVIIR